MSTSSYTTGVTSSVFPATKPGTLIMVGDLLLRGMFAGIIAGLLAFGFASIFGEPQVDRAIAFEEQAADTSAAGHTHSATEAEEAGSGHTHSATGAEEAEEPELVSRATQSTIGLLTGVVVYGTGLGGLFALVFAFAYGRAGRLSPRSLAALLAAAAFLVVFLVPYFKYPANPPAVGNPDTIEYRTGLYFMMVIVSVVTLLVANVIRRQLIDRLGAWNAALVGGAAFIVIISIAQAFLPNINEVPDGFPADLLWRFRVASAGIQVILWTTIGLLFGVLAERCIERRRGTARTAFAH